MFFLGNRGCRPHTKRTGKFATCLGREKEKDLFLQGDEKPKVSYPCGRPIAERKVCRVSPSGGAGERLGVVKKWEVSLMFIFA